MTRGRRLLSRPVLAAIALALMAAAATQSAPLRAGATPANGCGQKPSGSIYASGTASAWACQGDLLGVTPTSGTDVNGGAAANTTFSSSTYAIPEECLPSPNTTVCGRGEAGYGGGELPFGAVLIDAQDSTQNPNSDTFACSSGGSVVTSTETGAANSGAAPALAYHPGSFAGGTVANGNGDKGTVSGDTQCYTPYEQCTSAPTGNTTISPAVPNAAFCSAANASNSVPGKTYLGAEAPAALELEAAFYVPNATGNGSACKGHIVIAGGIGSDGTTDQSATYVYDPRYKIGGTVNTNFNTWTQLMTGTPPVPVVLGQARDTMDVVQLSATKWLLAGGETSSASNEYDIFDATTCNFTSSTMPTARYDFGMAKFGGFGSDVLACGGTNNFHSFAGLTSCDLYNQSTGTWTTPTGVLSVGRDGAFAQYLPTEHTSTTETILVAAQGDTGTTQSDECTETTSNHTVTCSNSTNSPSYETADMGFSSSNSWEGVSDSSHVLVGCIATENVCEADGYTTNSALDKLVFECGGFNSVGNGSSTGNDTVITCEYYVPSGTTIPTSVFGTTTTCRGPSGQSPSSGPAWCTTPASHMNRERAYFNLFEFPALSGTPTGGTQATSDEFVACGGFYGEGTSKFTPYLVRKNCEGLTKGTH